MFNAKAAGKHFDLETKRFRKELRTLSTKCIPYAMRDVVNGLADDCQTLVRVAQFERLTLRNRYLPSKTLVQRARISDGHKMFAACGVALPFAENLELGGPTTHASHRNPIPGSFSAGGSLGGKRKRKVWPSRSLKRLNALPQIRGMSRHQAAAASLRMARAAGRKAVLLARARGGLGLYNVPGKHSPLRLLYVVGVRQVHTPPHRTFGPALAAMKSRHNHYESLMVQALDRQRVKWKAFRYGAPQK